MRTHGIKGFNYLKSANLEQPSGSLGHRAGQMSLSFGQVPAGDQQEIIGNFPPPVLQVAA
jgi:hypothetical protein